MKKVWSLALALYGVGLLSFAALLTLALASCTSNDDANVVSSSRASSPPTSASSGSPSASSPPPTESPNPSNGENVSKLDVKWLGAAGFLLTVGEDSVMSAPLYTRPNVFAVQLGTPVRSDAELVKKKLDDKTLSTVRAIVTGHAHYDHLLDVPAIMARAPNATLYANRSARNLLAAYAPDRAAKCTTPAPTSPIARSRVVALDDSLVSSIDWTNCAAKRPAEAPMEGKWVDVPGSNVRVFGMCSEHPDQVGPVHFGAGDVDEEQCDVPTQMAQWKEGLTIAFLIDFLDPVTKAPRFRVYYQDAPTNAPIGHVPPEVLADHRVDVALLCVGSSNNVDDEPYGVLTALKPRYAVGGHWEDFFKSIDDPVSPVALVDVNAWLTKAKNALSPSTSAEPPLSIRGKSSPDRALLPQPGDSFVVAP